LPEGNLVHGMPNTNLKPLTLELLDG